MDVQGDTGDVEVEWDDTDLIDTQIPETPTLLFSLGYITDIAGPIDDDAEVRVEMGMSARSDLSTSIPMALPT